MMNFSSYPPGLVVIGIGFPKEHNTEIIRPNPKIAERLQKRNFFFADSFLTCSEVAEFFTKDKKFAYERASIYEFRTNARKAYLNALKKKTDKKTISVLDYTENVKTALSLENEIIAQENINSINSLKEKILFTQTFKRGQEVLSMIDREKSNVIYADLSLAYAIHLLTGCEIVFDCLKAQQKLTEQGFAKMKEGLSFFYEFKMKQKNIGGDKAFFGLDFENQKAIIHEKKGIRYFSNKETFYLMNGHPQNGFCSFDLSEYRQIKKE